MEYYREQNSAFRRPVMANLPLLIILILIGALGFWFIHQQTTGRYDPDAEPRAITPRGSLTEVEETNIALFENVSPSVVYITTTMSVRRRFSWNIYEIPRGTGSGFIWDRDGHIVTNYHVIEEALKGGGSIYVRLADQSEYEARPVGMDPESDLAVVQISAPPERLKPIPIGTSSDLRVGQIVYAIGNPFGFDQTLTTGVVSALGREVRVDRERTISGLIQTDASINPGNSGGPLLDSASRLIGVNTAIHSPSGASAGIGFAVPVDQVNAVIPQLLRTGTTGRAGLGLNAFPDNTTRHLASMYPEFEKGVLINQVTPGSAADRAGLRSARILPNQYFAGGDLIIGVDDYKIEDLNDLTRILGEYKPGDKVMITFIRDSQTFEVELTLQIIN